MTTTDESLTPLFVCSYLVVPVTTGLTVQNNKFFPEHRGEEVITYNNTTSVLDVIQLRWPSVIVFLICIDELSMLAKIAKTIIILFRIYQYLIHSNFNEVLTQ